MECPCPCEHCGNWFDLHDGYGSEKWYADQNLVICVDCHEKEELEIEEDDFWENVNMELSNALYGLDKKERAWEKLDKENQALIIDVVSNNEACEVALIEPLRNFIRSKHLSAEWEQFLKDYKRNQ